MIESDDTMRDDMTELHGRQSLFKMVESGDITLRTQGGKHVAFTGEMNLEMMAMKPSVCIDYRIVLRTDGTWSCYIQFSE